MKITHRLSMRAAVVSATMLASAPLAAESKPAEAYPAGAYNSVLAPYLNNQTLAVARVDLSAVNTAAVEKYVREMITATGAKQEDVEMAGPRAVADKFLEAFKKAGGKNVYAVLSHPDVWPNLQPVALLIPLEAGGDAKRMIDLVNPFAAMGGLDVAELKPGVIFVGHAEALKHLKGIKPEARPELLEALAQGNGEPLAVGITLTPDTRRVLTEMMPVLPAELGGGSTEFITTGLKYAALTVSINPAPQVQLQLSIRAAEDCTKVAGLLEKTKEMLRNNKDMTDGIKTEAEKKAFAAFLETLKPQITENMSGSFHINRVVLTCDEAHLRAMALAGIPEISGARDNAAQIASVNNLKQLAVGVILYRENHAGAMPESLEVVAKESKLPAAMLFNPADAKKRPYLFGVHTAEDLKKLVPAETPIAWEPVDAPDSRVSVAYLDGHVNMQVPGLELQAQLAKVQERLKTGK